MIKWGDAPQRVTAYMGQRMTETDIFGLRPRQLIDTVLLSCSLLGRTLFEDISTSDLDNETTKETTAALFWPCTVWHWFSCLTNSNSQ